MFCHSCDAQTPLPIDECSRAQRYLTISWLSVVYFSNEGIQLPNYRSDGGVSGRRVTDSGPWTCGCGKCLESSELRSHFLR